MKRTSRVYLLWKDRLQFTPHFLLKNEIHPGGKDCVKGNRTVALKWFDCMCDSLNTLEALRAKYHAIEADSMLSSMSILLREPT